MSLISVMIPGLSLENAIMFPGKNEINESKPTIIGASILITIILPKKNHVIILSIDTMNPKNMSKLKL